MQEEFRKKENDHNFEPVNIQKRQYCNEFMTEMALDIPAKLNVSYGPLSVDANVNIRSYRFIIRYICLHKPIQGSVLTADNSVLQL